jgi:hypothetical protein
MEEPSVTHNFAFKIKNGFRGSPMAEFCLVIRGEMAASVADKGMRVAPGP